jgi:protein phosphatase
MRSVRPEDFDEWHAGIIMYGPEYTLPDNLSRLRSRGLAAKQSLAVREFALGVEGLERFIRKEPLRPVH